jgi:hypothetical protein
MTIQILKKKKIGFHRQLNLVRGTVLTSSSSSPFRSQLWGSNRDPPYQVHVNHHLTN